jgi:predicted phosphodiesterase
LLDHNAPLEALEPMTLLVIAIGSLLALGALWTAARWSARGRRLASIGLVGIAVFLAVPELPHWEQVLTTVTEHTGAPDVTTPVVAVTTEAQPDLRFVVAGDVGTGDTNEEEIAQMAARLGRSDPFDALLLLGDNVYPSGDPAQLPDTVFEPFGEVFASGTELLAVLGNHDVEAGHGDAQAAALGMPGRWYSRELGAVLLVALDSTQPDNPDQLSWLEDVLASSSAPWRIVVMHHAPYSAGYHGSDIPTRQAFSHLFEAHGVQLVLTGHEHDYQRSVPIGGVTYIISGAGAKTRPTGQADFTVTSYSVRHVLDIGIWNDRLVVQAIGLDGVFDTVELTRSGLPVTALAASR